MTVISAEAAKNRNITYTDFYAHVVELTADELSFFRETVAKVLEATGIEISVETCDHDGFPGHEDALGLYHWNNDGDEFITIDTYFVHERYCTEVMGQWEIEKETLAGCICHELAHMRYHRHDKWHRRLTEKYVQMVA